MCSGVPATPGAATHSTSEYAPSGLLWTKVISWPGNRMVLPSPGNSTMLPLPIATTTSRVFLMNRFENLLPYFVACQHVRHPLDQARYVGATRPLVVLI